MNGVRAHIIISGLVQGVFFRDSTRRMANEHNVTGWVRNLPDGRVEALFEGEEEDVRRVIEWCWQGPSQAVVEDVRVEWEVFSGQYRNFVSR